MAAILYFGKDLRIKEMADAFFKIRLQDTGEVNSIVCLSDAKKLEEILVGMAFDLFLFEQHELTHNPLEFLSTFRKKYPSIKTPLVMVGEEKDPVKIMKFIEGGFHDYLSLPPDKPLLIEKINLYCTGKRSRDVRQVYSLQLSQSADMAKHGVIEELSEFDCKIRSNQQVPIDDVLILYSIAFSESGTVNNSVLGRCYETAEHPQFKGQFISSFYFIGVTTDILTNIRNTLRKSYVNSKTKS